MLLCKEPSTLSARGSSIFRGDAAAHGPDFAVDGALVSGITGMFISSNDPLEPFPWLEIRLSAPARVEGVKVTVRSDRATNRFKNVKVRAGREETTATDGMSRVTAGSLVGEYTGPAAQGAEVEITFTQAITAEFIHISVEFGIGSEDFTEINEAIKTKPKISSYT